MVAPLLALGVLQVPLLARDMRIGAERRFRVEVDSTDVEFRYRIRSKVASPPKGGATDAPQLELELKDYRATYNGRKVAVGRLGGGRLNLGASGLPTGLAIEGAQGKVWLPLTALYLPASSTEGSFDVVGEAFESGIVMAGKGTLTLAPERTVRLDVTLTRESLTLGKLTLVTTLDRSNWPIKASGTYVEASGTTHFNLERA